MKRVNPRNRSNTFEFEGRISQSLCFTFRRQAIGARRKTFSLIWLKLSQSKYRQLLYRLPLGRNSPLRGDRGIEQDRKIPLKNY